MLKVALKKLIRRVLDRLGYVVVKKPVLSKSSTGSSSMPVSIVRLRDSMRWDASVCERFGLPRDTVERDFERFFEKIRPDCPYPATRVLAVYCAMRYLGTSGLAGDVVDCGDGSSHTLAVAAAAMTEFGDTKRRLILCDVSGDPTHRAERQLLLWGNAAALPARPWRTRTSTAVGPAVPDAVRASGYPESRVHVVYSADAALASATAIGFLELTSESYPANRAARTDLLPRLARGGVLTLDTTSMPPPQRRAVPEFLYGHRLGVELHRVSDTYWVGLDRPTKSG